MLEEKKRQTNIGVGLGIPCFLVGSWLNGKDKSFELLGLVATIAGAALFLWGCVGYAQGKGHSMLTGFVGILGCFGLLILILLKDRYPHGRLGKPKREILDAFD